MVKPLDTIANFWIDGYVFGFILWWYMPTFAVGLLDAQEPLNGNPLHQSVCNL
jgi:hypothetical protein